MWSKLVKTDLKVIIINDKLIKRWSKLIKTDQKVIITNDRLIKRNKIVQNCLKLIKINQNYTKLKLTNILFYLMVTEPELIGGISVLGDSVANIRLGSRVNPDIGSVSAPAPVLNGSE